jgi:hypothetical protein
MAPVEEQITQYLYQGESIREAFDVGPVRIVLTSHRVFASDPDDEGIKQAELPNVTGVSRTTRGSRSGVIWGVALAVIGVSFLAVGLSTRLSDAFTAPEFRDDAAEQAGAGGLTSLVDMLIWLVENIDAVMLGTGAFFLLVAVLPVVHYWFRVRERTLAIQLAGEQPDIHLPLEYIAVEDEFRLEKALVPEQVSDDLQVDEDDAVPDDSTGEGNVDPSDDSTGEGNVDPSDDSTGEGNVDPSDDSTGEGNVDPSDHDGEHSFEWIGGDESDGQIDSTGDG